MTDRTDAERLADGLARTLAGHFAANSIPTWETIHAAARELGEVRALYAEITRLQQERDEARTLNFEAQRKWIIADAERAAAAREAEALREELVKASRGRVQEFDAAYREKLALREEIGRLRVVADAARNVGLTSHYGHWDKTGGSGSGCSECHRQREWYWPLQDVIRALDESPAQPSAVDVPDDPNPQPYHQREGCLPYPDPGPALNRALLHSSRLISEGQPTTDDMERAREIYDKQVEPWQRGYSSMSYVDYRQRGIELIAAALTAAREQGRKESR